MKGHYGPSTGARPVGEGMRIDIANLIDEYRHGVVREEYRGEDGSADVLVFPPDLTNHERAVVHSECRKHGLTSKSRGKGDARRVTVFRRRANAGGGAGANGGDSGPRIDALELSRVSWEALRAYTTRFPPTDEEMEQIQTGALAGGEEEGREADQRTKKKKKRKKGRRGDDAPAEQAAGASAGAGQQAGAPQAGAQRAGGPAAMPPILPDGRVGADIRRQRASLPIASFRGQIVETVARSRVVLVAGETGCGKTTQVPQFILEDSWSRGEPCKIVCTQPRRISAMTVSERVATERGEVLGEGSVGYQIRLDSRGGAHTSLMFCTNGILLRRLTGSARGQRDDGDFDGITHIVMDEIHERDSFADFLMIVMREIVMKRPNIRLVLMSATVDVELFSEYFSGCPVISVPGFTHPVTEFYLEDALNVTGFAEQYRRQLGGRSRGAPPRGGGGGGGGGARGEANDELDAAIWQLFTQREFDEEASGELVELSSQCLSGGPSNNATVYPFLNYRHSATGVTPLHVLAGKGYADEVATLLAHGADATVRANDGLTALDWAVKFGHAECAEMIAERLEDAAAGARGAPVDDEAVVNAYLLATDQDEVDIELVRDLAEKICVASDPDNAILVFLPGWDEIGRLRDLLLSCRFFGNPAHFSVLPLHSMVEAGEQKKVFRRPRPGVRKIVLATNIAETAVTIDDIVYVIDSGRVKEKSYDAFTAVSTLQSTWISKANERQRAGRAGRVRPGFCYHLYSRSRSAALAQFQLPEIKRTPLEELCLQVKLLQSAGATGAPEGRGGVAAFLGAAVEPPLPVAVDTAMRLLEDVGALDADERITSLGRHLASLPLHPRIGKMLIFASLFDCVHPVLTVACSAAYKEPFYIPLEDGGRRACESARQRFDRAGGGASDQLAIAAAYDSWADAMRSGRGEERRFCQANYVSGVTMNMIHGMRRQIFNEIQARSLVGPGQHSRQAQDTALVRSVVGMGFYPMVGKLLPRQRGMRQAKPAIGTPKGERVRIHPASVNSKLAGFEEDEPGAPLVCAAYSELVRDDALLRTRQSSLVHPLALLLVANSVRVVEVPAPGADAEAEAAGGDSKMADAAAPPLNVFVIDDWLSVQVPPEDILPLLCLRLRLSHAFAHRIEHSRKQLPTALFQGVRTASSMLSQDGCFSREVAARVNLVPGGVHEQGVAYHHRGQAQGRRHDNWGDFVSRGGGGGGGAGGGGGRGGDHGGHGRQPRGGRHGGRDEGGRRGRGGRGLGGGKNRPGGAGVKR